MAPSRLIVCVLCMCEQTQEFESLALKLDMTNEHDLAYLRRKVKRLKRNPQLSFSSSFSSFDFSHSAISLHLLSQTGTGDDAHHSTALSCHTCAPTLTLRPL
jgi:hypothetical protein